MPVIPLGNRITRVWTICPRLLQQQRSTESWTHNLLIVSLTLYQCATTQIRTRVIINYYVGKRHQYDIHFITLLTDIQHLTDNRIWNDTKWSNQPKKIISAIYRMGQITPDNFNYVPCTRSYFAYATLILFYVLIIIIIIILIIINVWVLGCLLGCLPGRLRKFLKINNNNIYKCVIPARDNIF